MATSKSSKFDYQATSKALEELLETIESEELDVDGAIAKFEKGMKLVKDLEGYLDSAENRIEKIKKQFDAGKS